MKRLELSNLAVVGIVLAVAGLFLPRVASAQTLTTLYVFQGPPDGAWPCGVVSDAKGNLYGTTQLGGRKNAGSVFKWNARATGGERVLHSFHGSEDGREPCSALVRANGDLYGTANYSSGDGYGTVFRIHGHHLTVLYRFQGGWDGAFPNGVIRDGEGALYGTTALGGGSGPCDAGCGVVFKLDKSGRQTVLHNFSGPDGAVPAAGVIRDEQGILYGTTLGGGANNLCPPDGCGTVFKLDKQNKLTVLHSFTGGNDGWYVASGVVRDQQGNLYGTTSGGGPSNMGTVYKITPKGKEKVLYSFKGVPDGWVPQQLLIDSQANLYGTAALGGLPSCANGSSGCGTVFKLDRFGKETTLYRFNGESDGISPTGSLVLDSHGNLYGTTVDGPWDGCTKTHAGCGTIWKLTLNPTTDAASRSPLP